MNTHKFIMMALTIFTSMNGFAEPFTFESQSFKDGDTIPMKHVFNSFGCKGQNVSPELHWANPPSGTKSFALTVYDPDAPTGSGWWHWTVFNIPTTIHSFREGESFKPYQVGDQKIQFGKTGQGRTDFGKPGYGGPCPPEGDKPHRYQFTLHALKVDSLDLNQNSSGALVGFMINANTIEKRSFTGMFGRSAPAEK